MIYSIFLIQSINKVNKQFQKLSQKQQLAKNIQAEIINFDKSISIYFPTNRKFAEEIEKIIKIQEEESDIKKIELDARTQLLFQQYEKLSSRYWKLRDENEEQFALEIGQDAEESFNISKNLENEIVMTQKKLSDIYEEKTKNKEFANPLWNKTDEEIRNIINSMTLEEKSSQLFIFTIPDQNLSKETKQKLEKLRPGGIVYLGENISSKKQVEQLSYDIHNTNMQIPYFIAIDQEGGWVKRVSWDYTDGHLKWAEKTNEEICSLAKQRSKTLAEIGVNINLAPVVDLKNDDTTSFINNRVISKDTKVITQKAAEFVKCSREENMFSVLKHFPGHGATIEDSHFTVPKIQKTKNEWLKSDALPFIEINNKSDFVMIGHMLYKNLDPINPSSQSKIIVTDVLRNEFGYKKLIISDDMMMLHRSTKLETKQIIKDLFLSGIDIALYAGTPDNFDEQMLVDILVDLIKEGEISEEKLDESVYKILKLKAEIV